MFKERSKLLFVATLLGTLYVIYLVSYFYSTLSGTKGSEQLGAGIATALVAPHMVVIAIGVILGWIGFAMKKAGFALAAAILYCVGGVLFLIYILFIVPSIVLGFVGYAKQKDINKKIEVSN